jgi:hypothetical protein
MKRIAHAAASLFAGLSLPAAVHADSALVSHTTVIAKTPMPDDPLLLQMLKDAACHADDATHQVRLAERDKAAAADAADRYMANGCDEARPQS